MCGFCTETAALCDLLGEMKDGSVGPRDPFLYPIYLQEASDWRGELRAWQSIDHPRGAFIALCRQWSERLAGGRVPPLEQVLSAQALDGLQEWLGTLAPLREWQWTLDMDGRPPDPLPLELARETLDAYIEGWLRPPFNGATDGDQKALHGSFLSVSVAFDIVCRCAPDDSRLTVLTTSSHGRPPFFDGLELWLQRRALQACVVRSGVSFIMSHFDELRIESIFSVVIHGLLTGRDLLKLQVFFQNSPHGSLSLAGWSIGGPSSEG